MTQTPVVIIGASLAGLACAACLQRRNIAYVLIEREAQTATSWRNHYHRLHLHTTKHFSHLPYKPFSANIPLYPSRQDVVNYLDAYQQSFAIKPLYNTEAMAIKKEQNEWITETSKDIFQSRFVIVNTGNFNQPKMFSCNGIKTFQGQILHSAEYKTGKDFQDKNVLIIGFGNSACEIAIDLHEQGAYPSLSVRSAVDVVPRDLLGIPIQYYTLLLSKLPPRVADSIIAPIMKWKYGNLSKYGLQKVKTGAFEQIKTKGITPVLDIGTMKLIKQGNINVFTGIDYIQGNTVYFNNGKEKIFDAIIAAIGYENRLPSFLDSFKKQPLEQLEKEGLYTCGFTVTSTGFIRRITHDAKRITKEIAKN